METEHLKDFGDVLCTLVYSESLQFILRRVSPMSAQLEILVVDRLTGTIRNTIMAMQFEGCGKDDLNYHMLVNTRPAQRSRAVAEDGAVQAKPEVNQLILLYPNGILCIYDNIL